MELWLVRHGDTITESDGLYKPHNGLTELGVGQANAVAEVLAKTAFDVCYSSALPRAIQTAQIFADLTSNSFTKIEELNEIEVGRIEDAPVEVKQRIINHQMRLDFSDFGGEDETRFSARVIHGLGILLNDATARNASRILAFLHGGTIGAILDHLAGESFNYRRRPRMPNCSYTIVRETSAGVWTPWKKWHSDHLSDLT